MTPPSGSPALQPPQAAQQRLYGLAGDVADQLRSLTASDWEEPLWRLYERLQQAHARYFRVLGGARMGAHRADPQATQEAMRELLLWALLALYRAGRE